ncbi:hypothetical protein ABKV19_025568, partial [Rosa sericea]
IRLGCSSSRLLFNEVCSLGLLMASLAHGRKLLNGLVFSLLLPCLIFSQLGQAIIWEKILE